MDLKTDSTIERYFAASNSYLGFVSYFDEIFSPEQYERIYIIKGGPGTGKSSFMKKIHNELSGRIDTELIFCSSDTNSLDGVILKKDDKRVALLDGTAPHSADTKLPGAVDELLNLGDFWESAFISAKRDKIRDLCDEKSKAYSTAYSYLKIAGECQKFIDKESLETYDSIEGKRLARKLCESYFGSLSNGKRKTRLISAFGKDGEVSLDLCPKICDKNIFIDKTLPFFRFLIKDIAEAFAALGTDITVFPSALDGSRLDGILLSNEKIFIGGIDGGEAINTDKLYKKSKLGNERLRVARELSDFSLGEAVRWFGIASELHFELENIYSGCMNFELVDRIFVKTLEEIQKIFELKP